MKNQLLIKQKVEKFRRISICSNETDFSHKIKESNLLIKNLPIPLNLKLIELVTRWLKFIDSKCFKKLMNFYKCIQKQISISLQTELFLQLTCSFYITKQNNSNFNAKRNSQNNKNQKSVLSNLQHCLSHKRWSLQSFQLEKEVQVKKNLLNFIIFIESFKQKNNL